jgi:hypothetical protein
MADRLRQVDGPVRAEWFGAIGDDSNHDLAAINSCLLKSKRVKLLANRYLLVDDFSYEVLLST